jgi:N-carbamoyl-L-amino-acid hydrolase
VDTGRVIADLRELDRRTGGPGGARRLCWGDDWRAARGYLDELLAELGLSSEADEAGNAWAYLEGDAGPALALGSHLDSVPGGGWLDGALGVMAALGVLRSWAGAGRRPPRTLALVDWADEEGSRFGHSLFGSSAATGRLDPAQVAELSDADGRSAAEVLTDNGVDLASASAARSRLDRIEGYLELHIEQGPVLEAEGLAVAAVEGCVGIERWRFRIDGRAAHAGTTPMDSRRDAGLAAADAALAIERLGRHCGGVATTGQLTLHPGVPTAVPGAAELVADLRHRDPGELASMLDRTRQAVVDASARRDCEASADLVWRIEPTRFDESLVASARAACARLTGVERSLTSGALHDAAAVAGVVPAAMVFCSSIGGVSHAADEDTQIGDLETAIAAFAELASDVLAEGSG